MSKRGAEFQGGEERYGGSMGQDMNGAGDDKPQKATAAQLARRKIAQAKGKRGSRQASPAVAIGGASTNPFQSQSFQPPPAAEGFSFSMPGATAAPSFAPVAPPQQNGSFGTPGQNQPNGTPNFGGFGNNQNNTPSFGSGFASNNSQPQQNGFNPSTSFGFSQNQTNGTASTPSTSFSFGQTQSQSQEQPKQNGFTPSTNFSFGGGQQSQPQNGPSPSFSFGQSQPQQETPKPSTPSFSFEQQPQTNGDKPANTGLFGSTPVTNEAPKGGASIFSGLQNGANGIKPGMFTQSQTNREQTPKASNPFASIDFGQANKEKEQAAPKPAFGFGQQDKPKEPEAPKPAFSFSGRQDKEQQPEAPKPAFSFGQQAQVNGEQTPKPTNPFTGFNFGQQEQTPKPAEQEKETPKTNHFGNIGQQKESEKSATSFNFGQTQEQQTPKPTGNMFGGFGQSQPSGTPAFKFGGAHQKDTSMLSANNTPQKPSAASTEPERPADANADRSMFDRIPREPRATAPKPSFSFGTPAAPSAEEPATTGKSLFDRMTPREPEASAMALKSSSAPFSMPATTSALAPPHSKTPVATVQPTQQPTASTSNVLSTATTASDRAKLKELNEGLLSHLKTENPSNDWSVIFQYYMSEAAKVTGKDAFQAPAPAPKALPPAPSTSAFGSTGGLNAPPAKPSTPPASTVQAQASAPPSQPSFAPTPSTPAPAAANIFSQAAKPPATAPVNRKRAADEDATEQPATEKRVRPNEPVQYPKLPDTASNTAKLFASTLDKPSDKPAAPSSAFKPSTTFKFGAPAPTQDKPAETPEAPTFGFTPSTPIAEKPAEAPKAPSLGFTPSTPAASEGFKMPTFTAPVGGSGSFLSAFGKRAASEVEKEKKKRMDDDYDSDEEDRATWEAKDKAAQEAKRKLIEEAAKSGSGFSFSAATDKPASSPFAFKLPDQDKPAEIEEASNLNAGKSLFDRITPAEKQADKAPATPSLFSSQTPSKSTSSVFGTKPSSTNFSGFSFGQAKPPSPDQDEHADKAEGEKDKGTGDNTWKPSTPIKFGALTGKESTTPAVPPPANPFAGLFGSNPTPGLKPAGSEANKLAPPSMGFNFGGPKGASSDVSRATTPGLTTDGETSNAGDNDDEPKDKQVEDMTQLLPEEREGHEVLLETPMALAKKMDDKKDEDGGIVRGWVEKGKGPMYILKNKDTGKTRVLLKIPPLGRAAMNFGPLSWAKYEHKADKKSLTATFVDHLDTNKEKRNAPSQWMLQVREIETAAEIARILTEEKGKQ